MKDDIVIYIIFFRIFFKLPLLDNYDEIVIMYHGKKEFLSEE